MLRVSDNLQTQWDAEEERRFHDRIAKFLWDNVPALRDIPPKEHLRQTQQIIFEARQFEFETEKDIAIFALSAALLGPDFYEAMGGVREILELKEPPEHRAKLLEYFTCEMFDILGGD